MIAKRAVFVIVAYLFIAASFQQELYPFTILFGMVGGYMIGHATVGYVKGLCS